MLCTLQKDKTPHTHIQRDLGSVKHPFITIALRSTLTHSGDTY